MKQMIVITDGCSNVGVNPVVAAAHALTEGITVNVIGVVDDGEIGQYGAAEIAEIAVAGGGMSRIVASRQLSQTVQMLTRQTVAHTIQQAVNKQLQHIFAGEGGSLEALPPEQRSQVVEAMDELGEQTELRVALLIDASASMKPKLAAVEEAIRDLTVSLRSRQGESELAVFHFPGSGKGLAEIDMDVSWTKDIAKVRNLFYKLNMKGTTPTGPAILRVVEYYIHGRLLTEQQERYEQDAIPGTKDEGGMLSGYMV